MSKKTEVKIVQDEKKPVPIEVIATSIKAIADGVRALRSGPLKENALLLLIQNAAPHVGGRYGYAKLSAKQIRAVLNGIESLEAEYLKAKP